MVAEPANVSAAYISSFDGRSEEEERVAPAAWREARTLVWAHRRRLLLGLTLMLISRLAGLVLPASHTIDDVVNGGRSDLLMPIALAAGAATLVQAVTSFALGQILGVAAQRAITDMRKRVQARIMHLPVRYFDSTQTGVLISRIMNDAEGIRNLVGTGLVQLVGGLVTAVMGIGVLFWLNWHLTVITILVLLAFGGGMATRSAHCVRCSASAARSTPKSPAGSPKPSAASASSSPTRQRSAKRSSSPKAHTACSGTSPSR